MINKALKNLALHGSSFLYDLDGLFQHANNINKGSAKLFFACKANPLKAILQTLHNANICFDVASEGELQQVLSLGVLGVNIIMTGPAKPRRLIQLALENKISTIVIESALQLKLVEEIAKDYDHKPNILFRLQLLWTDVDKNILGGDQITSLGMDIQTAKILLQKITLPFIGFHIFQWGNILSVSKLEKIWEESIKTCKSITSDFQVLDVGGGLGITYDNNAEAIQWVEINRIIEQLKIKYHLREFWLELGRYMTGPFGYYITPVIDIKQTYGKNIIILEGGINHLTRPALISQSFPAGYMLSSNTKQSEELEQFFLYGPLCTSLDFMGEYYLPKNIQPGDNIIFKQVGAYGFTESMPFFLCHTLPGEGVLENGKLKIARKPEDASSWLK